MSVGTDICSWKQKWSIKMIHSCSASIPTKWSVLASIDIQKMANVPKNLSIQSAAELKMIHSEIRMKSKSILLWIPSYIYMFIYMCVLYILINWTIGMWHLIEKTGFDFMLLRRAVYSFFLFILSIHACSILPLF